MLLGKLKYLSDFSRFKRGVRPSIPSKVVENVEIILEIILADGIEEVEELSGVTWSSI